MLAVKVGRMISGNARNRCMKTLLVLHITRLLEYDAQTVWILLILMLNFSFIECTMGEARLVNGDTENEGTVEICYHDLWGLISDLDWDESDAKVVCRQLGYSTTSMLHDN